MRRTLIGLARLNRLWVAVALMALAGCGPFQSTAQDPFGNDGTVYRADRVVLQVRSEFNEDVVLYALTSDGRRRLGEVARTQHAVFQLPLTQVAELRLRVEVLAGPRYTTNALSVQPGDRVELWIPPDVERAFIRRR